MHTFRTIPRRRFLLLASAACTPFPASIARAVTEPLLIRVTHPGGSTGFTEQQFASLPQTALTTHTAWTAGPRRFDGVRLSALLEAAGLAQEDLSGRRLRLLALNDYEVSIPAEDCLIFNPLLARSMDGTPMERSGKGPLWLVYPRDDFPELIDQRYDHRWAWQLAAITLE